MTDHEKRAHAMHNASSADIWSECDLYYPFKREAEAKGEDYNPSNEHADRGRLLHELAEQAAGRMLDDPALTPEVAISPFPSGLPAEDLEQVEFALEAFAALLHDFPDAQVALEANVPLSHEPASTGAIDVAMWDDETVVVLDYKFGRGEVHPDSPQLKIYAANLLERLYEKMPQTWEPKRVLLAIVQPRLRREALIHEMTLDELWDFQDAIEAKVAHQLKGHDLKGAKSLDTCQWCPFTRRCAHRVTLVAGMLDVFGDVTDGEASEIGKLTLDARPELVEQIVRAAKGIEAVIADCKALVIEDEERFPDWRRTQVANGWRWNTDLLDESEIAHRLRLAGGEDIYRLKTVADVRRSNPQLEEKLDELLAEIGLDGGHHVRLKYVGSGEPTSPLVSPKPPAPSIVSRVETAMGRATTTKGESIRKNRGAAGAGEKPAPVVKAEKRTETKTKSTKTPAKKAAKTAAKKQPAKKAAKKAAKKRGTKK